MLCNTKLTYKLTVIKLLPEQLMVFQNAFITFIVLNVSTLKYKKYCIRRWQKIQKK